jgi:small GTP-binding protein
MTVSFQKFVLVMISFIFMRKAALKGGSDHITCLRHSKLTGRSAMNPRDAAPHRAAKVIVLGDSCVGKTSIILRGSKSQFDPGVEPTIGTAYITARVETPDGEVPLNIWDTAGQERFKSVIPMYLRGAAAVILVCAVDAPASFRSLNMWLEMVGQTLSHLDTIYLAANKIDRQAIHHFEITHSYY